MASALPHPGSSRRRRRHRAIAIAGLASLLVHLVLLAGFLGQVAPELRLPEPDTRPAVRLDLVAAPALLAPTPPARTSQTHRQPAEPAPGYPRPYASPTPAAAPLGAAAPAAPPLLPAKPSGGPGGGAAARTPTAAGRWAVRPDIYGGDDRLARALRARYGCLTEDDAKLTREERADCELRVGREARLARAGAAMDLGKRAYFDAVADAYQAIHDTRPTYNARGEETLAGHPPTFGCKLGGKGAPASSFRLGPCFVAPPQGVLTEESAVPKPY